MQFNVLSTISFSIVVPAVFETAQLMRSFHWIERFASWPLIPATRTVFIGLFIIGLTMLTTMLVWPKVFYPFAWTSLVFIFEPINYWTGRPHFLEELRHGDWRTVISLSLGALVCGLFWEMWNYYSFPKWVYHIPRLGFWHIFEMPLLGYGGYVPFALELYALKNFLWPNGPRLKELIRKLGKRSGANAQRSKEIWQIVFGWTSQKFSFNVKTAHTLKNS